jgi:hypothetical protein
MIDNKNDKRDPTKLYGSESYIFFLSRISYGHDRVKRNEFGGGRPCRVKGHKEKVDGTAKNVLWIKLKRSIQV